MSKLHITEAGHFKTLMELGQVRHLGPAGQDIFAVVLKGSEKECIVKYVNPSELEILQSLGKSNHIVETVELSVPPPHIDGIGVYLFLKKYPCDLLDEILNDRTDTHTARRKVITDISAALCFLKENNVAHGDIKPENVLCDKTDLVTKYVLTDFGQSFRGELRCRQGTEKYMSPETSMHGEKSFQSDLWSFGILIFVMFTRRFPMRIANYTDIEYRKFVKCGQVSDWKVWLHAEELAELQFQPYDTVITNLLIVDPTKRKIEN